MSILDMLTGGAPVDDPDRGSIEDGVVGWTTGEHFDIGSDANDGHTLLHVTLFRGRNQTKPIEGEGKAQGYEILARLGSNAFRIPAVGTPVIVAVPAGRGRMAGAAVIIATVEKSSTQLAVDRAVLDFGNATDVLIKGKSIKLTDYGGTPRTLEVGTPHGGGTTGVALADGSGGTLTVRSGTVQATGALGEVLKAGGGEVLGMAIRCTFQGLVFLGTAPTPANTAIWGPLGILGLPSPSVFVSAT